MQWTSSSVSALTRINIRLICPWRSAPDPSLRGRWWKASPFLPISAEERSPYLISKVTDASGKVLMQSTAEAEKVAGVEALDPRNAYIMHQMLHGVATSGTAAAQQLRLNARTLPARPVPVTTPSTCGLSGTPEINAQPSGWALTSLAAWAAERKVPGLALPVWIDYMRDAIKNEPNVVLQMAASGCY